MVDVLKYQAGRALDNVPAYRVSLQLRPSPSQQPVFIGLKTHGVDVYFDPEPVLHYDLEGRLIKWVETNRYLRRSLSHRVLRTIKLPAQDGGGIQRKVLPMEEADSLVQSAAQKMKPVADALSNDKSIFELAIPDREQALAKIRPLVERAARFDADAARRDSERFFSIYRPVAILPPDQYNALVLQATEGCAHNQCTFCGFYRDIIFHAKSVPELREHVRLALDYHGSSLAIRRGIFLEQANALTIPQPRLIEIFRELNETFEFPPPDQQHSSRWWLGHIRRFDGIYSFVDAFTGPLKTADDYRELRRLNLRRVYLGMETGDDKLLGYLNKPITRETVLETVRHLKDADLSVAVIVLLGAGGERFYSSHIRHTIDALNQMLLRRGDYIYFSPLVEIEGSEYFALAREAGVEFLSPHRIEEQEQAIRSGLEFADPSCRPIIARYDIEQFVY